MKKKSLLSEVRRLQKIAGLLKEDRFYAPSYIVQKYGEEKAKEIEHNIFDAEEMEGNPNLWDLFTSLQTPQEVDEFVQGFLKEFDLNADDDSYEQELAAAKAAVKGGTLIASADEGSQASPEGFLQYLKGEGKGKKFMYLYYEDGEEAGVVKVTPTEAYELVQAVEDPYKTKEIPERLPQPYNWELYAK